MSGQHAAQAGHPSRLLERFLLEPDWPLKRAAALAGHLLGGLELLGLLLAGVALAAGMVVLIVRVVQRRRLGRGAQIISVGVPPEVVDDAGRLLWGSLHDLLRPRLARLLAGQPQISWEIAASQDGTSFRIWVPRVIPPGLIQRTLAAAWPGASIATQPASRDETRAVSWQQVRLTSELVLSGPGWFSLESSLCPDPLPLVLAQLSELDQDQQALVQVVARPASGREQQRLRAAARRIRQGRPTSVIPRVIAALRSTPPAPPRLDPTIAPDVREALAKSTGGLYRCVIRVSVTAATRKQARGRIHAVLAGFAPYNGSRVFLARRHVLHAERKLEQRRLGHRGFLLGVAELAALCHLPGGQAIIPGVVAAGARELPAPPNLARAGKLLGTASGGQPVNLAVVDARQHLHILGPTGVGKSTLIANLALADFAAGRGTVVIDPKGDLVEDLLQRIPDGREGQVDLLDPLDPSPPGLNVLDSPDRDLGTDQLVGIFRRVFERFWGPRTDDILRAALLTLAIGDPTATLADVPRLLSDRDYQTRLIATVKDPVGLDPFWAWYGQLSDALRAQVSGPVLNKLRAFLLRAPVRAIVGQQQTTLDIPKALDDGRLLLAKLSKGTLGEDTSRLLGSFIVARVWQATLARAGTAPEQRPDSALYVDEVHNYLNLPTPFEDIAAEARSYRLSLVLAHQHLAQLPREMREALAANARSKIYFQASRQDAIRLERELSPQITAHDLAHLPRYTAAVRLCHDGQPTNAFTLKTRPLPAATPDRAERVREKARQRGAGREQTEHQLAARHRPPRQLERDPRPAPPAAAPIPAPFADPLAAPPKNGAAANAKKPRSDADSRRGSRSRQPRQNHNG